MWVSGPGQEGKAQVVCNNITCGNKGKKVESKSSFFGGGGNRSRSVGAGAQAGVDKARREERKV